ncbi:ABC transporter substrate-binding protein [Actinopolymorpha alba]|uniref:ABC transporter substrate-binding protein n=1 Tax=Actinopolymorpha alba TaxID=533267 RepID=UPI0012F6E036|nr:ABC transporter substrate-binding protein [Actinopolymorpha alba]
MTRRVALRAGFLSAGAVLVGCSTGGKNFSSETAVERPVAENVAGRKSVPAIELLTKTAAEDPSRYEQSRLVAEAWQQVGIQVKLVALRSAELTRRTFTGKDFDVSVTTYDPTAERLDPDNFLSRFYSANATEAGSNLSRYASASYDRLYEGQRGAIEEAERMRLVSRAQRMLYDHQPARPIVHMRIGGAFRSDRWSGIQRAVGSPVANIWNLVAATPTTARRKLVIGTTFEPPSLNPASVETSEAQIPLSYIYDSLVRIGRNGDIENWAATSVGIAGARITAKIRPGMSFSDGQPVTPADVAFTIDYLIKQKSPLFATKLEVVSSVSVDGDAVVIRLKQPSAAFVPVVLSQLPILPRHVWEKVPDANRFPNDKPIGSGPFTFASRRLGEQLEYAANRGHFSAPKVDSVAFAVLGSLEAEIGALESGEVDMLGDFMSATLLKKLEGKPGVTILSVDSHGWVGLHYNVSRKPFDDRHFRRALSFLVPSQDIIDVVLEGEGKAAGSVIAPNTRWHDKSIGALPTDPKAAMRELKAAGYAFGKDDRLYYPSAGADKRVYDSQRVNS